VTGRVSIDGAVSEPIPRITVRLADRCVVRGAWESDTETAI